MERQHLTSIPFSSSRTGGLLEQCAFLHSTRSIYHHIDSILFGDILRIVQEACRVQCASDAFIGGAGVRNNGPSREAILLSALQQRRARGRTRRRSRHPRALRSIRDPRAASLHAIRVPQAAARVRRRQIRDLCLCLCLCSCLNWQMARSMNCEH